MGEGGRQGANDIVVSICRAGEPERHASRSRKCQSPEDSREPRSGRFGVEQTLF